MANLRADNLCGVGFVSANDGTVWSNYVTGGTLSGSYPATNGFDGNIANFVYAAVDGTMVWTPPNGGIKAGRIEVYVYAGNTHPIVRVNGVSTGAVVGSATPAQQGNWVDVTELVGGHLKTITCYGEEISGVDRQSGFAAVRINGEILTDSLVGTKGGRNAIDGSVFFDGVDDTTFLQVTIAGGAADFTFGTGDFTIEFWMNHGVTGSYDILYDGRRDGSTDVAPMIYLVSGVVNYYTTDGSGGGNKITGTSTLSLNSWHHISLNRESGSTKLYVNGIQEGSTYSDSNSYVAKENRPIIGGEGPNPGNNPFGGYISNLRICKGHAVYNSNYTPPTQKLELHKESVLLCCQDSDDPTQEATGKTITGYGGLQESNDTELVTNSGFTVDISGWTTSGVQWTHSNSAMMHFGNGNTQRNAYQDVTTVIGKNILQEYWQVLQRQAQHIGR